MSSLSPAHASPSSLYRYPEIAAAPTRQWWRPVVTLLLGFAVGLGLVLTVEPIVERLTATFLVEDLASLAGRCIALFVGGLGWLIIAAVVLKIPFGRTMSVAGRFRWGLLLKLRLACLPLYGLIALPRFFETPRQDWWLALIVVAVVMPLQVAGEEFAFRGAAQFSITSLLRVRVVRSVVAALVSTALFSVLHQPDTFEGFLAFCITGLTYAVAAYFTGGLEAAIAIHLMNNLTSVGLTTIVRSSTDALDGNETGVGWAAVAIMATTHAIALSLVLLVARWSKAESRVEVRAVDGNPVFDGVVRMGQRGNPSAPARVGDAGGTA